jgi:hypothetical protein
MCRGCVSSSAAAHTRIFKMHPSPLRTRITSQTHRQVSFSLSYPSLIPHPRFGSILCCVCVWILTQMTIAGTGTLRRDGFAALHRNLSAGAVGLVNTFLLRFDAGDTLYINANTTYGSAVGPACWPAVPADVRATRGCPAILLLGGGKAVRCGLAGVRCGGKR